jgi:hypothetical protein
MTRKRTVVLYEKAGSLDDHVVLATSDPRVVGAVESAVGKQVGAFGARPKVRPARGVRKGSMIREKAK